MIFDRDIRKFFGYQIGNYYLCFYATTAYSVSVKVNEADYMGFFDIKNSEISTTVLAGFGNVWGMFTDPSLASDSYIYFFSEGQEYNSTQEPPKIYYKVCTFLDIKNCGLSDAE